MKKNFAVLTSAETFSSGNDTAEGWSYSISCNIHLINAAGEDIDAGVPVSTELVAASDDGTRDYSAFYDFDRIRECMR